MWWYSTVYILQVKSHIPVHVVPLRFTCKIVQDTLYILYLQDRWVGTCINNMDNTLIRLRNGYKAEFCNGWYTVNIFCVYDNWRKIVF